MQEEVPQSVRQYCLRRGRSGEADDRMVAMGEPTHGTSEDRRGGFRHALAGVRLPIFLTGLLFLVPGTSLSASHSPPAGQGKIILSVPGIPGPYCAYGIEKRLLELDGVREVHLLWREEKIRAVIRAGEQVTSPEVQKAVRRADYPYDYSIEFKP